MEHKRVPCSKRDEPGLWTVYVTVRKRLIKELRERHTSFTSLPLSGCDHLIAILVNQGSDPTVPYQSLVIRESAMLLSGFAPCQRKAFSAREPGAAEVYSPEAKKRCQEPFRCLSGVRAGDLQSRGLFSWGKGTPSLEKVPDTLSSL